MSVQNKKFPKKLVILLLFCNFIFVNQITYNISIAMITTNKVTEIFCILDEFCKNLDAELTKKNNPERII